MKTINLILSHILRIALLFLLSFIWLRFYEKNLWLVVLYASLITIIVDLLLNLLIKKKTKISTLQNDEIKKATGFANYFIFNAKSVAINFFKKLFSTQFEVFAKTNYLYWIKDEKITVAIPVFTYDTIKIRDIINAYNNLKIKDKLSRIIILGSSFDKDAIGFSKSFPVKVILFDKFDCYEKLMKQTNTYPEKTFEMKNKTQNKMGSVFQYAFNRKHTKAWLFSSLILILSSFFVKVSIYYLIISSILLIFAIIALCNNKSSSSAENIFN